VLVQSVDALHLVFKVPLFVLVRQCLVGGPRLSMLFQMATIVEKSKRLCEIFNGQGCLSLAARITADLHAVLAFVDVEKTPHNHISFGILGDDL